MKNEFTILIADRNRHVREFLKREIATEGYGVRLAKSGREVMKYIYDHDVPVDLLILDPDLPDAGELEILKALHSRIPVLPLVIHTYLSEYLDHPDIVDSATVVEKKGSNIDHLKKVVFEMLRKSYPKRFHISKDIELQEIEHTTIPDKTR